MTDKTPRLHPEDQQRVDRFNREGINAVERKPFRPLKLMLWLAVVILALGLLSRFLGQLILS